jgi:replicative DNA helicase
MSIKNKAKEYLRAELSVIPTDEYKRSVIAWKPYQTERMREEEVEALFSRDSVKGIAIICGAISGGLEVIDIDAKYDTTGSLWDRLRSLIEDNLPELYSSLVIAQTKSGGYHIYYRCSLIEGNKKLAQRYTTEEEKVTEPKEKVKVLIETRGEAGYVIAPPSSGYSYIQGKPTNIPTITETNRGLLFKLCRSLNEVEERVVKPQSISERVSSLESPFEDYNQRGDIVALLERHGWRVVDQDRERVYLLRPGQTDSKHSGDFHTGKRVFKVFSTSTEFEAEKGYAPSTVYSLLECSGDNKLAYRRLLEEGYGQPYRGEAIKPTRVKTERITVEAVNRVNTESSVISSPGESLKIENIQTALGDEVVISSPGLEAQEEVLKAIELIQETGKRVYIVEDGIEIREYRYQLRAIFNKYATLQDESGELTDRERDNLLDEVVISSLRLQPIDRDTFKKEFLNLEAIKELGISEESLSITLDRLTSTRDREARDRDFSTLLAKVTELKDKGEIGKALELLEGKVKEVKLQDKATEYSNLLKPIKEEELKSRLSTKPDSISSGYNIGGEELLLPAGAISIISAPTSHGKTTFLINTALNVCTAYPDKEVYLFSYEEDGDSILINTLNSYIDTELSSNNRRTLKSYFSTGSLEYVWREAREYFETSKDKFFRELIDTRRLNIHYSSYNSDTLIEAIRYIHKHANPGAIFIDYIQLLNLPEGKYKTYSRQEEIKEICIALKDLAVETGLPIILGAQFNREVTNQLKLHATKIGEAGDIERIANLILAFWNNNFTPIGTDGEMKDIKAKQYIPDSLYVTVLKNRGGRVDLEDILTFNGNKAKISSRRPTLTNKEKPTSNLN